MTWVLSSSERLKMLWKQYKSCKKTMLQGLKKPLLHKQKYQKTHRAPINQEGFSRAIVNPKKALLVMSQR
jgi:hypothetical protein